VKNALFRSFVVLLTLIRRCLGLLAAGRTLLDPALLDPGLCIFEEYCPIMVSEYFTMYHARNVRKIRFFNYKSSRIPQSTWYVPDFGQVCFLLFAPSLLHRTQTRAQFEFSTAKWGEASPFPQFVLAGVLHSSKSGPVHFLPYMEEP